MKRVQFEFGPLNCAAVGLYVFVLGCRRRQMDPKEWELKLKSAARLAGGARVLLVLWAPHAQVPPLICGQQPAQTCTDGPSLALPLGSPSANGKTGRDREATGMRVGRAIN